jgi:hypothetical protein
MPDTPKTFCNFDYKREGSRHKRCTFCGVIHCDACLNWMAKVERGLHVPTNRRLLLRFLFADHSFNRKMLARHGIFIPLNVQEAA